eukprot:gb/GFBE01008401.1/.p1 GENE.gb/GFBE01008401.1/~~gb/GFBE01008401.1/.p1  ORF type:complete len:468 (+),score=138.50 gb/GFBE01008401.1/:1-1404(+)
MAADKISIIRTAFENVDMNKDGFLDKFEFGALLRVLDPGAWTSEKTYALFQAADVDGSGNLDLNELLDWMLKTPQEAAADDVTEEEADAVLKAFREVDVNKDGSLTKKEFGEMLKVLDPKLWDDKKIKKFFKAADKDGSGKLDYDEVKAWLEVKSKGAIEPPTEEEEMYTILTMVDGRSTGSLRLGDLIEYFELCKTAGLGPRLVQEVPQDCEGTPDTAEELTAAELAYLYAMVTANRDATGEDARAKIADEKAFCRTWTRIDWDAVGVQPDAIVGFGVFKRLLDLLTATMCIDRPHLLTWFSWAKTSRFELTDSMAEKVMIDLFLKVPRPEQPVLVAPIGSNDFNRLCFSMNIIDIHGRTGIPQGRIAILFQDILKTMPRKLAARQKVRYSYRPDGKTGVPATRYYVESSRRSEKKSIRGKAELSVLMESLFFALPPNLYLNVMDMVLAFLAHAAANPISPSKNLQ